MAHDVGMGGLLTLKEASVLLRVHSSTLRRWSDQGKIETYRFGPARRRKFRRKDVGALLIELTQEVCMAPRELSLQ